MRRGARGRRGCRGSGVREPVRPFRVRRAEVLSAPADLSERASDPERADPAAVPAAVDVTADLTADADVQARIRDAWARIDGADDSDPAGGRGARPVD